MKINSVVAALAAFLFLASAAEANIITVTGNTAGGPTYNRPLEDLSALSAVGTSVAYNTYKITTDTAGDYSFLMTGVYDTFASLYSSSFDPTAPLTNALVANDDRIVPPFTTSGFVFTLAASTDYYFVATGFGNSDSGSFSSTIGGPGTIAATPVVAGVPDPNNIFTFTGDTTGGPTYNRPLEDLSALSAIGTDVSYQAYPFTVDASGDYTFMTTGEFDTFVVLYDTAFNPAAPLSDALKGNDDLMTPPFTTSGLVYALTANMNYVYITTGFGNTDAGQFSTTIAGPGAISPAGGTPPDPHAAPEPGTLALLALSLAGIAYSRRRQ